MRSFNAKGLLFKCYFFFSLLNLKIAIASDLGTIIALESEKFLNRTYQASPLGEGSGMDPDPLIRFDAFDCTTFVETMGAIGMASSKYRANFESLKSEQILEFLTPIRYINGEVSFIKRKHFISLDWIPGNIEQGLLQDITSQIGGAFTQVLKTIIDPETWFLKNFGILVQRPPQVVHLPVIRVDDLLIHPEIQDLIPQSAIMNITWKSNTLKEKIGTDLDIRHQGLIIKKDSRLFFRNASSTKQRTLDIPLVEALNFFKDFNSPAVNFNIYTIKDSKNP